MFPAMAYARFPDTIDALTESWNAVRSTVGLEPAGVLFFKRLFETAPEAIELFSFKKEDNLYESPKLKAHALKVMTTVGVAVSMLNDVPKLLPVLRDLGQKHIKYGVTPGHYDIVGRALLETLALGLGDAFTPALKAAWTELYGIVATTMIGSKCNYPSMATKFGRYADPVDDKQEELIRASQASAKDWYSNPKPMMRAAP